MAKVNLLLTFDVTDTGIASLANNGTFSPDDGNSRWMGSAAMDAVGNIGVAYSVSGPSTFPSIRYSGRLAGDAPNVLTLPETEIRAGEGSQSGANRWGDYSSLSVDPVDDCTFWYTTEYDCIAGPAGKIEGVVSDSSTGLPIPGVQVTVGALTAVTNANGEYTVTLPVSTGNDATAFKYGWVEGSAMGLDVIEDETTTADFVIDPATPITVTGTVRDGSGLNVPLFADIVVAAPGTTLTTVTDPITGEYNIDLFEGTLVKMTASVAGGSYMSQDVDILPENTPVQDFALMVTASCTAIGYEFTLPSYMEDFEGGVPPAGWTIADTGTSGATWQAASATSRGNLLGTGEAAAIDSDAGGFSLTGGVLTSPVINVADLDISNAILKFASWFRTFGGGDVYNVEINVDGAGWTSIQAMVPTNRVEEISIDLAANIAGATSFQLRWNYEAVFEWYAYVDDITIGGGACVPRSGSILRGAVIDANTGLSLDGASIVAGADSAISMGTESADVVDGIFTIFVADGVTEATVSLNNYQSATVPVADISLAAPVALEAPQLDVTPESVTNVTQGRDGMNSVVVDNTGNVDADGVFLLTMLPSATAANPQIAAKINGPFHPSSRHFGPKALSEIDTKKIRHRIQMPNVPESTAEFIGGFVIANEAAGAYGIGLNQDNGNFWLGDVIVAGGQRNALYQYDAAGVYTGNSIDNDSISNDGFSADIAYNNRTGMFWQVEVGNDGCIHEFDPVALTLTGNKICPQFGTTQRGLTYDPLTNTFYSGSFNDSIIHQFDTTGAILRSVSVQVSVSGLAFNPVTNSLYVLANDQAPAFDVVVPNLLPVSAINFPLNIDFTGDGVPDDLLPDFEQSGLAIDCDGNLWTPVRPFGAVLGIRSGETNVCEWKELPWLKFADGNTGQFIAQSATDVELEFDTSELPVGTYQAQLVTTANTPYPDNESVVTLNVTAPNYGSVGFASNAPIAVLNGQLATLTVNRTDGSDFAISVDYQTANATALAGTHYNESAGTLTWEDGDTSPKTITVRTRNTSQPRDLGLSVVLSNPAGGTAIAGDNRASVVIFRDPPANANPSSGSGGGGSFGYGLLLLFGFVGFTRRRRNK